MIKMKLFKGGNKKGFAPALWLFLKSPYVVAGMVALISAGYVSIKNALFPPAPAPFAFLNNPWIIGGVLIVTVLLLVKK